jgi:hypothetical protein
LAGNLWNLFVPPFATVEEISNAGGSKSGQSGANRREGRAAMRVAATLTRAGVVVVIGDSRERKQNNAGRNYPNGEQFTHFSFSTATHHPYQTIQG